MQDCNIKQNYNFIITPLQNVSSGQPASQAKHSISYDPDLSLNSSLGLLPCDMMSGMGAFSTSLDTENCPPFNISLGRYLQPATQSEPLSDSDDDVRPQTVTTTHHLLASSNHHLLDTPPHPFLVPFPVQPYNQDHTSSTPLQANIRQGQQLHKVISAQSSGWPSLVNLSCNSQTEFNSSESFPWDKIVKGDTTQNISSLQKVSNIICVLYQSNTLSLYSAGPAYSRVSRLVTKLSYNVQISCYVNIICIYIIINQLSSTISHFNIGVVHLPGNADPYKLAS